MQYVNRIICALTIAFAGSASAAPDDFFIEAGLGVEYGGLGTQLHIPASFDNIDPFIAAGLFYSSSRAGEQLGLGAGVNYFSSDNHAFTAYGGTLHVDSYMNDNLDFKRDTKYGLSVGYKYYFSGKATSGFVLGGSYNVYDGGSYPFVTLGYRF